MEDRIIVVFKINRADKGIDIEIPLGITAEELIYGLNEGLHLGIDVDDPVRSYMRCENPIALIRGEVTVEELGLHSGSVIYMT
jgi:hypothetical protein